METKVKRLIKSALIDAKRLAPNEVGVIGKEFGRELVCKIKYKTIGDENRLIGYEIITSEAWDWEKAGCRNNEEWRRHLNRLMFADLCNGLVW